MKIQGRFILSVVILFMTVPCPAQNATVRRVRNGVCLQTDSFNVKVQFYADNIVRVVKWVPEGSSEKKSLIILQTDPSSVNVNISETGQSILLESARMKVILASQDGGVAFVRNADDRLLSEKKSFFSPVTITKDTAYTVQQIFELAPDEGLYGLGQHQNGFMNYRGRSVQLVQTNTDAVVPFLVSTRRYGILWDNYSKTVFRDDDRGMSILSEVGDQIDYYLICGDDMDDVIAGYRYLTGPAPMYGKWAYGYWQSREHYASRSELLNVVCEYRRRKIPIDNIIQDWRYWGGEDQWSGMIFDEERYPDPGGMIDIIHDAHFHIMFSIWPGLGTSTEIYKDMRKRGYLFNTVGWASFKYFDAFIPEANDLYWHYLKMGLFDIGADAWWIDSTEPDIVNATMKKAQEYEMKKVGTNHIGSWARYLNAYSLSMTGYLYRNQRRETDQKRVYILTRSAFAGQQRNAATTWSGDIGASWEVYRKQIAAGINFCMSGLPYWTFDIGAFVIGAYGGVFSRGGKDPAYQELYTRMFQFGAFCPVFRAHGSETPREIWEFGEFEPVLVQFDQLRYRLLPYLYSLAWRVTSSGYTIMRGLPMDFTEDPGTFAIDDQFMFGPAVMVCPVTTYMIHRPPEPSVPVSPDHFRTADGRKGILAKYYRDHEFKTTAHEQIESDIDHLWYTGRPDYMTDSAFAVRWEGKLIPDQTGPHQFHLKSYDTKRIFLDGKLLPYVYTSVEQYTACVDLEANREYNLVVEMENRSTGAAKMQLFWKTPDLFSREEKVEPRPEQRSVYLPAGHYWIDFWTGHTMKGGRTIRADAPVERIPLLVKAGSILPMGPFIQYADEKPADPIELRIYGGADAEFILYEDENDTYNYEKGIYATIRFHWDDTLSQLTIDDRKGSFPGMPEERSFNIVLVRPEHGTGIDVTKNPDRKVLYRGERQVVSF